MGEIVVKPLDEVDCMIMAMSPRAADALEIAAMTGQPDDFMARFDTLVRQMDMSRGKARAAYHDGALCCIWGVTTRTLVARDGMPWMIGSAAFEDRSFQRIFAKRCRREFAATIPASVVRMWNLVHDENKIAIRWLKWLGFTFKDEPVRHGGLKWVRFEMES